MPITSKEVRKLAIKACQSGKFKQNDLAELFEVSTSTLSKWVKIFKESQRESPRDRGHRAKCFTEQDEERLQKFVNENPDITLKKIHERLRIDCSLQTINNTLKRLGLDKKSRQKAKKEKSA